MSDSTEASAAVDDSGVDDATAVLDAYRELLTLIREYEARPRRSAGEEMELSTLRLLAEKKRDLYKSLTGGSLEEDEDER